MKFFHYRNICLCLLFTLLTGMAFAGTSDGLPDRPNPPRLVNDYANMMNPNQQESLEQMLRDYADSTSTQITVVTVPTLNDRDISEYATALGQKWGVGGKKNKNGVVILASSGDHKVFIATGYGMEGVLPDATVYQIVEDEITPEFKTGNYYNGFQKGVLAIIQASKGEYTADHKDRQDDGSGALGAGLLVIFIIIFVVIMAIRGGGGRGGGGGHLLTGAILGSLLSNSGRNRSWGSSSGWGSSGGSWGSSGGGGGGFGGFGGGSFGGGGAGGSW